MDFYDDAPGLVSVLLFCLHSDLEYMTGFFLNTAYG